MTTARRIYFPKMVDPRGGRLETAALRRRVMRWLKHAGRPMTHQELCQATAIRAEPMRELLAGMIRDGMLITSEQVERDHGLLSSFTYYGEAG